MKGYLKDDDSRDTVKPSDWLDTWLVTYTLVLAERVSLFMKKDKEGTLCQSVSGGDSAFKAGGVEVKQLQTADYF